jgi:hypothetical protein
LHVAKQKSENSQSLPELKRILIDEWNAIPHSIIDGLITSAPERFRFYLKKNGASIDLLNQTQTRLRERTALKPKIRPGMVIPRNVEITKIGSMVRCFGVVSRIDSPDVTTRLPRQVSHKTET